MSQANSLKAAANAADVLAQQGITVLGCHTFSPGMKFAPVLLVSTMPRDAQPKGVIIRTSPHQALRQRVTTALFMGVIVEHMELIAKVGEVSRYVH